MVKELLTNSLLQHGRGACFSGYCINREEQGHGNGCSIRMDNCDNRYLPVCFLDTDRLGMTGARNRIEVSDDGVHGCNVSGSQVAKVTLDAWLCSQ